MTPPEGEDYPIPAGFWETEILVRKSRFIARVVPVTDRREALAAVEQARLDYPDARHHCWAYVIGKPGAATSAAMNDDGEPSGTAGKPILNVMEHKGLGDLVVVVIRYFGGIKLGAGGLVRAYAGATEAVLSAVEVRQAVPKVEATLRADFSQEQRVRHWLEGHGARLISVEYGETVTLGVTVPATAWSNLVADCDSVGVKVDRRPGQKPMCSPMPPTVP